MGEDQPQLGKSRITPAGRAGSARRLLAPAKLLMPQWTTTAMRRSWHTGHTGYRSARAASRRRARGAASMRRRPVSHQAPSCRVRPVSRHYPAQQLMPAGAVTPRMRIGQNETMRAAWVHCAVLCRHRRARAAVAPGSGGVAGAVGGRLAEAAGHAAASRRMAGGGMDRMEAPIRAPWPGRGAGPSRD